MSPWVDEHGGLLLGHTVRGSRAPFYELSGEKTPRDIELIITWRCALNGFSQKKFEVDWRDREKHEYDKLPTTLQALLPVALAVRGMRHEDQKLSCKAYVMDKEPLLLVGRGLLSHTKPDALSVGAMFALTSAEKAEHGIADFAGFGQCAAHIQGLGRVIWGDNWHVDHLIDLSSGTGALITPVREACHRDPERVAVVQAWATRAVRREATRLLQWALVKRREYEEQHVTA